MSSSPKRHHLSSCPGLILLIFSQVKIFFCDVQKYLFLLRRYFITLLIPSIDYLRFFLTA